MADTLGDPEGDIVLLLHGGGQTRESWGGALDAVAGDGFCGISLDLRGHGESEWAQDGDYRFDAHVADLQRVLRQLEKKPFIIGASLGGVIGLLLAGEAKEELAGLAMIDIVPRFLNRGTERIIAFMTGRPHGFASIEEAADAVAEYLPHRPRTTDQNRLRKNLRLRDDGRYYWHWDPEVMSAFSQPDPETMVPRLEVAAAKLNIPTLLVRGANSDVVDSDSVAAFRKQAPHADYVEIPDAEHMVAGDRNDLFNNVVLDFLEKYRVASV